MLSIRTVLFHATFWWRMMTLHRIQTKDNQYCSFLKNSLHRSRTSLNNLKWRDLAAATAGVSTAAGIFNTGWNPFLSAVYSTARISCLGSTYVYSPTNHKNGIRISLGNWIKNVITISRWWKTSCVTVYRYASQTWSNIFKTGMQEKYEKFLR